MGRSIDNFAELRHSSAVQLNRYALTEWREVRGLSKSALAVLAGISLPYMCDLEKGHRPGTAPVIKRLADALKVNVFALVANPNTVAAGEAPGRPDAKSAKGAA